MPTGTLKRVVLDELHALDDPGMAPLFGVAGGLVAEMGGTLSHGAIMAREYGLPVLANVPYATSLLCENEQVQIVSSTGVINRLVS